MVALGRVRHDKMKDTQVLVSTLQRPHGATSSRIMSFSSSGKEAHLNTAVVAATKKRYETYKQATQLYFDVQRAKGEVYHVLFQRDGALGFSLHLVRDGEDGRTMIVVDRVNSDCEHGVTIKTSDELVMIYDFLLVQPTREDFLNILQRLAKSMRPLKLTFAKGKDRLTAMPTSSPRLKGKELERQAKLEAMRRDLEDDLAAAREAAKHDVLLKHHAATEQRLAYRKEKQESKVNEARAAAAELLDTHFDPTAPRVRAESWRAEAALLARKYRQKESDAKEVRTRARAASGMEHLDRVVKGSVVRMVLEGPDVDKGDALYAPGCAWHGRVGIVSDVRVNASGEVRLTVTFADAPLNRSVHGGHHPAVQACDGVAQAWKGDPKYVEVLVDHRDEALQLEMERSHNAKRASLLADHARDEKLEAAHDKGVTAHIFRAAPGEAQGGEEGRARAAEAAERERIRQTTECDVHAGAQRGRAGSIFTVKESEDKRERELQQKAAVAAMEDERKRREWEGRFAQTRKSAVVEHFDKRKKDRDDYVKGQQFGLKVKEFLCLAQEEEFDAPPRQPDMETELMLERSKLWQTKAADAPPLPPKPAKKPKPPPAKKYRDSIRVRGDNNVDHY